MKPATSPQSSLVRALPPEVWGPFLLYFVHSLCFALWIIDDAAISLAYGHNLLHGHGLVAQAGAEPVEGFSNPLWTLITAPLTLGASQDPTAGLKTFSWLLTLGTFMVVGRLVRRVLGSGLHARATTGLVLFALSLNTSFVIWTTAGLENPLYVLLVVLYCGALVDYAASQEDGDSQSPPWIPGLWAGALALTRPDGVVFLVAFPAVAVLTVLRRSPTHLASWRSELRRLILFLLGWLGPWGSYLIFRVAYFGDLYPNTYHAKGGPGLGAAKDLLLLGPGTRDRTFELLGSMFGPFAGWVGLGVLLLTWLLATRRSRSLSLCLIPVTACSWAIYCLLPTDWMGEFRFATPFFVVFFLFVFLALAELAGPNLSARRVGCLALILTALWIPVYLPRSIGFAADPPAPFDLLAERALRFNHYADALDIGEASWLTPDLGGPLFFSRHEVRDLAGLCDRDFARLIRLTDNDALRDYVLEELRPTFINTHSFWAYRSGLHLDLRFRRDYIPLRVRPGTTDGIPDGEYVLRSAVPNDAALAAARALGDENAEPLSPKTRIAFPRS